MKKVNILDCTLRDGAYIVDAKFGNAAISGIIHELTEAKIDIIEVGWLKDSAYEDGTTFFHTPDDMKPFLKDKDKNLTYVAMIDWNRYDVNNLTPYDGTTIDAIRVVFPREHYKDAVKLAEPIRAKGYRVFFQAANTLGYTDEKLIDMIHTINEIAPESLSVVDTFGAMYEEDLMRIVAIVDHNLDKKIKLGLHTHNNLQQSFSLSMAFVKMLSGSDRELIIDGSLAGMGRGAGNATTELLAGYLNRFCSCDYDLNIIMDAIDLYMTHFIENYEWGYSIPYFLAGTYCSHVNNIAYLKKSHRTRNADIKGILESMPEDKRLGYDYDLLEQKYVEYKNIEVNDAEAIQALRSQFQGRKVLLIAPGQNVTCPSERFDAVRNDAAVIKVGVNAVLEGFDYDYLFFSNEMRYKYALETHPEILAKIPVILTSNVMKTVSEAGEPSAHEAHTSDSIASNATNRNEAVSTGGAATCYIINFNGIAKRGWVHFDNSVILFLRLLDRLHVNDIALAGVDGYKPREGYADGMLRSALDFAEIESLNREIMDMFDDYVNTHASVTLEFVTNSVFDRR